MIVSDLMYILIIQMTLILVILLSITYLFSGREIKINNMLKINIGFYVGFIMSFIYIFNITNHLYLFVIVFSLLTFYIGCYSSLTALSLILIFQAFYHEYNIDTLLYLVLIILVMFIKIWFKDIKKLLIIIFILSLFFLNLEIWLSHSNFIIINLFATIVFVMLLLIVYKIQSTIKSQNIYNKQYYYDLVTNVRNYYCLLEYSASILSRKNSNIAFILINIDHLKDINNLYGVYFGNKVIKLVAEIIKKNISDFGDDYRIDGDTFCVVSNEKYKIIKTICDRIRHEIDIKEVITDNNKINISVSIGAYCGLIYSKNIDDYIELAQDALFKSKSLGRNKVIINNLEDK